MKKLRVVSAIVGVLLVTFWVLDLSVQIRWFPHFDFFWNVLLGIALGVLLSLLPLLTGAATVRVTHSTQWWIGAALILLVLLFQYLTAYYMRPAPSFLRWLTAKSPRALLAEGTLLGYAIAFALRAKR